MADFYTEEQVTQILQTALARQPGTQSLSREQVCEIANELGVSREVFLAAEQQWLTQQGKNMELVNFDVYKKKKLRDSVLKYAIVNSFLVTINLFGSGQLSWAIYPLLIWGLVVALEGWTTYHKDSEGYKKKFEQWHRKQQRDRLTANLTAKITNKVASKVEEWLK